jgi:AraC-like DNA-binding protein
MLKSPLFLIFRLYFLDIQYQEKRMSETQRAVTKIASPLDETLHQLRLDGSLYCRSELTAPWGLEMPPMPGSMMFHIVTSGSCWLQVPGREAVELRQGSLALVPHGQGHRAFSRQDAEIKPLFDMPVEKVSDRYEVLCCGGGGELTQVTCGVVLIEHAAADRLVAQLPDLLVLDGWDSIGDGWLQSTLQFISREANDQRLGGETILTHLADILVIQAIRNWLETAPEARQGWLAALRDRHIGQALLAIHQSPGEAWTVESLARRVGMSRSGFSARFSELVGDSVKSYLTQWRMQIARKRLQTENETVGQLAFDLGYGSEAAFSRAFKRVHGYSPSALPRANR